MNKKIIALILVVPFAFLYLMFGTSVAAAINVDVPVNKVIITNQLQSKTKVFDLADYHNDFFLEVQVLPTQAKNKGYNVKITKVDDEEMAELDVDTSTGLVTPKTLGKSKITVESNDGAYRDSIIAIVTTTKPLSLDVQLFDFKRDPIALAEIQDGQLYAAVETGRYYLESTCQPAELATATVTYSSSDITKAKVNSFAGFIDIVSSGSVTITAQTQGASGTLTQKIVLAAAQADSINGITVNGAANQGRLIVERSALSASCIIETRTDLGQTPVLGGTDLPLLSSYTFTKIQDNTVNTHKYLLEVFFAVEMPELALEIIVGTSVYDLLIEFGDFTFGLYQLPNYQVYEGAIVQHTGTTIDYFMLAQPETEGVNFEWTTNSPSLVTLTNQNEKCSITTLGTGLVTVSVSAFKNGAKMNVSDATFDILVINNVVSAEFDTNTLEWGLAGYQTFGSRAIVSGAYKDTDNAGKLDITVFSGLEATETDLTQFEFSSSNPQIAEIKVVTSNGKLVPTLKINGTGFVDLKVNWKYQRLGKPISSTARVECVKDGVNINTYQELVKASEDGHKLVLCSDIMLGKQNASVSELMAMTKTMTTTYNAQFYKNLGRPVPSVRYCIEFKNDVYGNGHYINGEYIAKAEDKTGVPLLFKGALNLVEVEGTVSVMGQDNIVFLVRTDNIVLDNITLMGCSDDAILSGEDGLDLSKLKLTGTVLEVMSDARILNSRIKNGRNTVRVYGGNKDGLGAMVADIAEVNVAAERINVSLEGSIITQAREFLLKIGTNRVLAGSKSNNAPNLKVSGREVSSTDINLANNAEFYDQLVLTDMTVRDCVFAGSGLFAIGIDTNYAGPALLSDFQGELEGLNDMLKGWDKLGGTSFASFLRLEGDVRFYEWKPISSMDSSTIVETYGALSGVLNIDLDAMVNKAVDVGGQEFENLIYLKNNEKFVSTAIFMFGGGKNYSQVSFDGFVGEQLPQYSINASVLTEDQPEDSVLYRQGKLIPLVIGDESFRCFMYNTQSDNNFDKQVSDLGSGHAYDWMTVADKTRPL